MPGDADSQALALAERRILAHLPQIEYAATLGDTPRSEIVSIFRFLEDV